MVGSSEWLKANERREVAIVIPAEGPTQRLAMVLHQMTTTHTIFGDGTLRTVEVHPGLFKEAVLREVLGHYRFRE